MAHGAGGKLAHELIKEVFIKSFKNNVLLKEEDSAVVNTASGRFAFTTDTFVVKPIFFPGGDIGKLAVCGTVNDLAVSGATPRYISCGFVIEEGFRKSDLIKIAASMADWAREAGVEIVAGDTKVVARGEADGIFINTAGVGEFDNDIELSRDKISAGDKIIISGTIGDHGIAVLSKRKGIEFDTKLESDCAPLNALIKDVLASGEGIKFMRDPTRGGVAAILNETAEGRDFSIAVDEEKIPVSEAVRGASEMLGLEPLYIANEGKVIIVAAAESEQKVLSALRKNQYGREAASIGEVKKGSAGKVIMKTRYGAERILDMLIGEPLPRIC